MVDGPKQSKAKKNFIYWREKKAPAKPIISSCFFVFMLSLESSRERSKQKNTKKKNLKNRKIFLRTVNSWFSTFTLGKINLSLVATWSLTIAWKSVEQPPQNNLQVYQFTMKISSRLSFSFGVFYFYVLFCFLIKR